jgi:hypothetical protein
LESKLPQHVDVNNIMGTGCSLYDGHQAQIDDRVLVRHNGDFNQRFVVTIRDIDKISHRDPSTQIKWYSYKVRCSNGFTYNPNELRLYIPDVRDKFIEYKGLTEEYEAWSKTYNKLERNG